MQESDAVPSTGRLIGEALDHWATHQGRFWMIAGPAGLVLTALSFAGPHISPLLFGGLEPVLDFRLVQSGIHVLLIALVLYQWFKYALYDDWSQRRRTLLGEDRFPWRAFVSGGFIAFWMLQWLLSTITFTLWGELVRSQMPSQEDLRQGAPITWLVHIPIGWIKEIALAALFGGFLLFLPARAVGISWGPGQAFHEAAGTRRQMIAIALFLTFLLFVSERALNIFETLVLPPHISGFAGLIILFASTLLLRVTELMTLYMLAHTVSRLFVLKTGWTPEPYPQPWTLDSTARE
ncbi:hypothetical protein [Reyranella sp.]|uniref:hypothetical protein n=1 Tax=Reyranella sp. TaxID=1929291 RepID=UPI003BA87E4D